MGGPSQITCPKSSNVSSKVAVPISFREGGKLDQDSSQLSGTANVLCDSGGLQEEIDDISWIFTFRVTKVQQGQSLIARKVISPNVTKEDLKVIALRFITKLSSKTRTR
jgi:hypothetical protein